MTRDLDTDFSVATKAEVYRDIVLVYLDYASGPVRVASTPFPIDFDADGDLFPERFLGVGALGSMSNVEEGIESRPYSLKLQMRGIQQEDFALTLLENYQGRPAKIWLGLLDDEHKIIASPNLIFEGRIDTQDIDPGSGSIEVTIQSRLVDWERSAIRRYTDDDQQAEYPGDLGLKFVHQMEEKQLPWAVV